MPKNKLQSVFQLMTLLTLFGTSIAIADDTADVKAVIEK